MVTMVINELKSISRLKIFRETEPLCLVLNYDVAVTSTAYSIPGGGFREETCRVTEGASEAAGTATTSIV